MFRSFFVFVARVARRKNAAPSEVFLGRVNGGF
jgi:hypothetical protein